MMIWIVGVMVGCGKTTAPTTNSEPTKLPEATATGEKKNELKEINIGFPSSGGNWPSGTLGVADSEGYLDAYLNPLGYKANLKTFAGAAPAIHEALVSGDLDFAYYAGMAGVLAKSNGIDTKLLAVQSYSPFWELATLKSSGITDIKQLKGASIAYTRGTAIHEYLIKVLQEVGLSSDDVKLVNMTIPESISALVTGSVDVAVIGIGQEIKIKDALILHNERAAGSENYYSPSVITGRTAFVNENSEVTVALLESLLKAKDKIVEDPSGYYKLYAEKSGYPLEYVLKSTEGEDITITFPLNFEDKYIQKLKGIQKFLIDSGLIKKEVDFNTWIDKSYLEKAQEGYEPKK